MGICPLCGSKLNSKNMCTNFTACSYVGTNSFDLYSLKDGVTDELRNNLVIVDQTVATMDLPATPEFFILGGAALVFHGLTDRPTMDIDTANRIDDNLREVIDVFVSDQASEVTQLGKGYQCRAVPYMEELSNIKVYLLSQEDLIITKVISNRKKDIGDLLKTNILTKHNVQKAVSVLQAEYPADAAKRYSAYIKHLLARKENTDFE